MTTTESLPAKVKQAYQQFLACFPSEHLDKDLKKKLRIQALEHLLNKKYPATTPKVQVEEHADLAPLTHALRDLPAAAAEEASCVQQTTIILAVLKGGYINIATAKWLKSVVQPLAANDVVPAPRSLKPWWPKVQRHIGQLHDSVQADLLNVKALSTIAPYLLGDAAWQLISHKFLENSQHTWSDFKSIVENDFGISEQRQKWQFLKAQPQKSELAAAFVKRMEVLRTQLSCDKETCVVAFFPRLPLQFQRKVEQAQVSRATYGQDELMWGLIVVLAKDELSGASVADLEAPTISFNIGAGSAQEHPRLPPVKVPQNNQSDTSGPGLRSPRVLKCCKLCQELGIERAYHNDDGCYLNPRGSSFKQEHYDRKLAYLYRNKLPVPALMQMPNPPSTPAYQAPFQAPTPLSAAYDSVGTFEAYVCSLGLPKATTNECIWLQREKNIAHEGQHMFFDMGDGVDLPDQQQEGEANELQAASTFMDQLLSSSCHSSTKQEQRANKIKERNAMYSELLAAMHKITKTLLLQAAADDEAGSTASTPDVEMEGDAFMDVPLVQIQKQLQQLQQSLANQTQSLNIKSQGSAAGRIIRLPGGKGPKAPPQLDNKKIAKRIGLSLPLLRATITDATLRNLILCQLISLNIKEGRAVVMPDGAIIHQVAQPVFDKYCEELGVNHNNFVDVTNRLQEMGIDGRGNVQLVPIQGGLSSQGPSKARGSNSQANFNEILAQFNELAQTLQHLTQPSESVGSDLQGNITLEDMPTLSQETLPIPTFVEKNATNHLQHIGWQPTQYIAHVQIGEAVTYVMLDTGGHASIIDMDTALKFRLDATKVIGANYGHYHSPGYKPRTYAGIVEGPVPVRFSQEVIVHIPSLRVITSKRPLFILGADMICGGSPTFKWNYHSIPIETSTNGEVKGQIVFVKEVRHVKLPLNNVPKMRTNKATPAHPPPTTQAATRQVRFNPTPSRHTFEPAELYDWRGDDQQLKLIKAQFIEIMQKLSAKAVQDAQGGQCL